MPENIIQKNTKQIIILSLLLLCCFLLSAVLLIVYKNGQNGRYGFTGNEDSGAFYVFDTKTGQVWQHYVHFDKGEGTAMFIDYGTPVNPSSKIGPKTKLENDYESLLEKLGEN